MIEYRLSPFNKICFCYLCLLIMDLKFGLLRTLRGISLHYQISEGPRIVITTTKNLIFLCFKNRWSRYEWQRSWNTTTSNKLHELKPQLGEWPSSSRLVRREEVILSRLRIGHTYLTNSYLLKAELQPECIGCQCPLTVKHILLECIEFDWSWQNHFNVDSLGTCSKRDILIVFLTF